MTANPPHDEALEGLIERLRLQADISRDLKRHDTAELHDSAAEALQALRSRLAQGDGWRPIEEAPKDGTPFLITGGTVEHPDSMAGPLPFTGVSIAYWNSVWNQWDGESVSHDDNMVHEPTHFMPLPAPPALSNVEAVLGEGNE